MGYKIDERSNFLQHISEKKWVSQAKNEMYVLKKDNDINQIAKPKSQNL